MFVNTLSIDDAETGVPETYAGAQISMTLVEELIRRLESMSTWRSRRPRSSR